MKRIPTCAHSSIVAHAQGRTWALDVREGHSQQGEEVMRHAYTGLVLAVLALAIGCSSSVGQPETRSVTALDFACGATEFRYPTTAEAFSHVYSNRRFYADGNHLGYDIQYPEGTPIHPIACGTLKVYRGASGYGTLVAVVEHHLPEPVQIENGLGARVTVQTILSIYGHIRPTTLARGAGTATGLRVGQEVGPDDVLGYIENEASNGDGREHLHLGIRLQSAIDAQRADASWFRGYDEGGRFRASYADPAMALPSLMTRGLTVRWHPAGTVIATREPNRYWILDGEGVRHAITGTELRTQRLLNRVHVISDAEFACEREGSPIPTQSYSESLTRLARSESQSTVYEWRVESDDVWDFISYEAFLSWGWQPSDIVIVDDREVDAMRTGGSYQGHRRMRNGSLVKTSEASDVFIVADGRRYPIASWDILLALGYGSEPIYEVDSTTIDAVAGPVGSLITADTIATCAHPSPCLTGNCDAGRSGGGGVEDASFEGNPTADVVTTDAVTTDVVTADASADVLVTRNASDARLAPSETCNGLDDDQDGRTDEDFLCRFGMRGSNCVTTCGAIGYRECLAPSCSWSTECATYSENCDDTIDNDCDGRIDCADSDCSHAGVCTPVLDAGMRPDVAITGSRPVMRYEFRIDPASGWATNGPAILHDLYWANVPCEENARRTEMSRAGDWFRCDTDHLVNPFVGSFFDPAHTDWGDRGHLGTVGNAPERCTPTAGIEWRITNLTTGVVWRGTPSDLACVHVGTQDRHGIPTSLR